MGRSVGVSWRVGRELYLARCGFLWVQSLFRYLDGLLDMVASSSRGNYDETAL